MKELSLLIANKVTSFNFFKGRPIDNFDSYMLYKDSDGKVEIFERKNVKPVSNLTTDNNNCSAENADVQKEKRNISIDIKEIKNISPPKVIKIIKTIVKKADVEIDIKSKVNTLIGINSKDGNIKIEKDSNETNTSNSIKPVILRNIPIKTNQLSQVTKTYLRNPGTSTSNPQLLILPKPDLKKKVIKTEYLKLVCNVEKNSREVNKRKSSLTSPDVSEPKTQKM